MLFSSSTVHSLIEPEVSGKVPVVVDTAADVSRLLFSVELLRITAWVLLPQQLLVSLVHHALIGQERLKMMPLLIEELLRNSTVHVASFGAVPSRLPVRAIGRLRLVEFQRLPKLVNLLIRQALGVSKVTLGVELPLLHYLLGVAVV